MRKRLGLFIALAFAALALFTGCISKEEKEQLSLVKTQAAEYMQEKYGGEFTIEESGYEKIMGGPFSSITSDNIWVKFTDGSMLYYDANGGFYDDRQSEEINAAILEDVWNPLLDELGNANAFKYVAPYFSSRYSNEGKKSFYHEYYDGDDIVAYLAKEKAFVDSTSIYCVFGGAEEDWQSKFALVESAVNKYFRESYKNNVRVYACTEEFINGGRYAIGADGCIAIMDLEFGETNLYVQRYIEIAEGIYVTAYASDGFELEEGDISLEITGVTEDAIWYGAVFSDRVREWLGDEDVFTCYIKLDEEVYGKYDSKGKGEQLKTFNEVNFQTGESEALCTRREPTMASLNETNTYYYGVLESDAGNTEIS